MLYVMTAKIRQNVKIDFLVPYQNFKNKTSYLKTREFVSESAAFLEITHSAITFAGVKDAYNLLEMSTGH